MKNQTRDYKIARPRSGSVICNHKFDFRPKSLDTKSNFHFIIFILKTLSVNPFCYSVNRKFVYKDTHPPLLLP